MIWRLVLSDPPICSLAEIKSLTLCEILDANEQLDLREEITQRAMERARQNKD